MKFVEILLEKGSSPGGTASVVTSTTTGYGDISPITNEARTLVKWQVIISLILIGLLVSIISILISEILRFIIPEAKNDT